MLSAAALLGFVVLARPSPSVLRAAVMGGVVLLALALGRARSAVPALAAAVLGLLLVDPALAADPGFALSVLATAALVLVAPGWAARMRRRGVPPGVAEALAVPAAACLVTAPLIAGLSGGVSLVAVAANLLAAPAVAPATVLGVAAAVLSPVSATAAQGCAWLAGPAVGWLVAVADRAAAVPGGVVPWPDGVAGAGLLAVVVLALVALARSRRVRPLLLAAVVGLLLVLVPTRVAAARLAAAGLGGGGLRRRAGRRAGPGHRAAGAGGAVDAGPDDGPVDACLDRLGVTALALVLVSHLHADHVGGLAGALRGRSVGAVAVGPVREPRWALERIARQAAAGGAPMVQVQPGTRLVWPALTLDVLGPQHPPEHVDPDDGTQVNDGSVVLRATTAAGTVLLTGDVEVAAQAQLLGCGGAAARGRAQDAAPRVAATARRSSSPPSRRGRCWSASARATTTGHPDAGAARAPGARRRDGPADRPVR